MIRLSEGHFELGGVSFKTGFHFVASWLKNLLWSSCIRLPSAGNYREWATMHFKFFHSSIQLFRKKKSLVLFLWDKVLHCLAWDPLCSPGWPWAQDHLFSFLSHLSRGIEGISPCVPSMLPFLMKVSTLACSWISDGAVDFQMELLLALEAVFEPLYVNAASLVCWGCSPSCRRLACQRVLCSRWVRWSTHCPGLAGVCERTGHRTKKPAW